jgi:hypothetical protein|tara:strand:+ start:174 stop:764 length:591 start_codon:yes stop_codon:yes gene_type:complete
MSNITGTSGLDGTVIDDVTGNGQGLMPDIYEYDGAMDNILVNNDIKIEPGSRSMGCADDILSGVLEETLLSKYFFSDDNVMNIQKLIKYEFYKEKNDRIDNQSNIILLTIMRGIYLKYSNSADKTLERIKLQIQKLNGLVVQYSLGKIFSNYEMHQHYLNDTSRLPLPMEMPKANNKNNYTSDLTARNNMSGTSFN